MLQEVIESILDVYPNVPKELWLKLHDGVSKEKPEWQHLSSYLELIAKSDRMIYLIGGEILRSLDRMADDDERNLSILIYLRIRIDSLILAKSKSSREMLRTADVISKSILDVVRMLTGKYSRVTEKTLRKVVDVLIGLEVELYSRGDYNRAISMLKIALRVSEKTADKIMTARIYMNIGIIDDMMSRYGDAEENYIKAKEILESIAKEKPEDALPHLASTYINLGLLYYNLNDLKKSEKYYLDAVRILEKLVEQKPEECALDLAKVHVNLGGLYHKTGELSEVEKHFLEAIRIIEDVINSGKIQGYQEPYIVVLAKAHGNLGAMYYILDRYEDAEKHMKKALDLWKSVVEKHPEAYLGLIKLYVNLGIAARNQGKMDEAEKCFKEVVEIVRKASPKDLEPYLPIIAEAFGNLGILYFNIKKYGEAEKYYLEALRIFERFAKRSPEAYAENIIWMLSELVKLSIFVNPKKGIEYANRLTRWIKKIKHYSIHVAFGYISLGLLQARIGGLEPALEFLRKGILYLVKNWFLLPSNIDAQLNAFVGESIFSVFSSFVKTALSKISDKKRRETFLRNSIESLEIVKILNMLRDIQSIRAGGKTFEELSKIESKIKSLYDQLIAIRRGAIEPSPGQSIEDITRQIKSLEKERANIIEKLHEEGIVSTETITEVSLLDLIKLFPDALYISFLPMEDKGFFAIYYDAKRSEGDIFEVNLDSKGIDELRQKIRDLLTLLFEAHLFTNDQMKEFVGGIVDWLPDKIKEAISMAAKEGRLMFISPFGYLHDIPWEFYDPDGDGPIGLRCPVVRAYSFLSIPLVDKRIKKISSIGVSSLVLGVVDPNEEIARLPEVEDECKIISKHLPNPELYLIYGKKSLPKIDKIMADIKKKLREKTIFYYSGHGLFIIPPEQSFLYIFTLDGKPIRITAGEIPLMRPSIPGLFAFLNACQTAKTYSQAPVESLIDSRTGFIYSLILSGFSTVIASLWSISSMVACTFAIEFFTRLAKGEPWDKAFLNARIIAHKKHPHSVDWAAYVIYGHPKALTFSP